MYWDEHSGSLSPTWTSRTAAGTWAPLVLLQLFAYASLLLLTRSEMRQSMENEVLSESSVIGTAPPFASLVSLGVSLSAVAADLARRSVLWVLNPSLVQLKNSGCVRSARRGCVNMQVGPLSKAMLTKYPMVFMLSVCIEKGN